jgi:hypothetical protein
VQVRRLRKRGHYDRATIDAILDEGLVCHVGFVHAGAPVVIPTLYWREGDHVYLHGSAVSRMLDTARGSPARPNDWTLVGEPSESAQTDYYREMFAACDEREWMRGFMLWDWPARLYAPSEASVNDDYCVFAKEAEGVVRDHYLERSARQVRSGAAATRTAG